MSVYGPIYAYLALYTGLYEAMCAGMLRGCIAGFGVFWAKSSQNSPKQALYRLYSLIYRLIASYTAVYSCTEAKYPDLGCFGWIWSVLACFG